MLLAFSLFRLLLTCLWMGSALFSEQELIKNDINIPDGIIVILQVNYELSYILTALFNIVKFINTETRG